MNTGANMNAGLIIHEIPRNGGTSPTFPDGYYVGMPEATAISMVPELEKIYGVKLRFLHMQGTDGYFETIPR